MMSLIATYYRGYPRRYRCLYVKALLLDLKPLLFVEANGRKLIVGFSAAGIMRSCYLILVVLQIFFQPDNKPEP
jgi:hypothetical protein